MSSQKTLLQLLKVRLLSPIVLALLLTGVQYLSTQNVASAASSPSTSVHAPSTGTASPALSLKPATISWLKTHPNHPLAPVAPMRSATPNTLTCQQNENCSCPSSFAPSQFYECEWFYGFWPFSGGVLSLTYWVDPNLPSNMQSWAITGANLWVSSAANVYFTKSGTQSSANVEIDAWHDGANCNGVWGRTSPNGPPISHVHVYLNVDNYSCFNDGDNGKYWIETAAHELGHSIGLEHNEWYDSAHSTDMLMNSCSACSSTPYGPQSMDITIVNAMYPPNLVAPSRYSSCNGWSFYLDERGYNQSGQSDSGDNIPASMAFLNTWYATSKSGGICDNAEWSISNPTHRCVDLKFWVPSGHAVVTGLTVTISSALAGHGTWSNTVNVNENAYTGFYNLGQYDYADMVSIADDQATPVGSQLGIGPIQLAWC